MKTGEELFRQLRRWYSEDMSHVHKWREYAKEDLDFYNNHQWSDDAKRDLDSENRPASEFNYIHSMIDAVVGTERNNKRKVQYVPRQVGKAIPSELLTGAADWFLDQSCASHADSMAFKDCVVCGMGWTNISLNFDHNPEGEPYVEHLDPLKMGWDYMSRHNNLRDARRLWYVDMKPLEVAQELFPNVPVGDLNAGWAAIGLDGSEEDIYDISGYTRHLDDTYDDSNDDRPSSTSVPALVRIVECRWYEREKFYLAPDLDNGGMREYTEKEYKLMKDAFGGQFIGSEFFRKVAYRAFLGRGLLEDPSPVLAPVGHLGWECMTGYYDTKLKHHYGTVRTVKNPQMWSNKFFSQMIYILSCIAKGGFLVEQGTFVNPEHAMEALTQPDGIVEVHTGALTANKIQLKPTAQIPNGFLTLFTEARDAISNVSGLSREFIGTREVDQAGILEEQRRQSSFNLLAELFDSVELYRKRQGKTILYYIQEFLSDGRLIRICGDREAQYVPLMRKDIVNVEYDIIIDDAPLTPNQKDRTFLVFMQVLPVLREILPPEVLPDIVLEFMSYSPLPATDLERIRQQVQQAIMMRQMMAQQMSAQGIAAGPAASAGSSGGGGGASSAAPLTSLNQFMSPQMSHLPTDINKV